MRNLIGVITYLRTKAAGGVLEGVQIPDHRIFFTYLGAAEVERHQGTYESERVDDLYPQLTRLEIPWSHMIEGDYGKLGCKAWPAPTP